MTVYTAKSMVSKFKRSRSHNGGGRAATADGQAGVAAPPARRLSRGCAALSLHCRCRQDRVLAANAAVFVERLQSHNEVQRTRASVNAAKSSAHLLQEVGRISEEWEAGTRGAARCCG